MNDLAKTGSTTRNQWHFNPRTDATRSFHKDSSSSCVREPKQIAVYPESWCKYVYNECLQQASIIPVVFRKPNRHKIIEAWFPNKKGRVGAWNVPPASVLNTSYWLSTMKLIRTNMCIRYSSTQDEMTVQTSSNCTQRRYLFQIQFLYSEALLTVETPGTCYSVCTSNKTHRKVTIS